MKYQALPRSRRADGDERRVGVEVEFIGLKLEVVAEILGEVFEADFEEKSAAHYEVSHPEFGPFGVELDWSYLKRKAKEARVEERGDEWVDFLKQLSAEIVPLEVVGPPITHGRLSDLDPMIDALRKAGARGTGDSPFAAFGVHFNPELPDLECVTLVSYLRAFALLQWWLVDWHGVDLSRRLTPYVDLYPEGFLIQMVEQEFKTREDLIDLYLDHNPTRNRALDMLPLFAELDESRVRERVDDERIKPRPTFHYRLPDCRIEEPDWGLSVAWNPWVVVERLAEDTRALEELGHAFLKARRPLFGVNRKHWVETLNTWLDDQGLV